MIDQALATGFDQLFAQQAPGEDDEELLPVLRHPRTVMTFSDSGAHVSLIAESSIQTHLLAYWVRERQVFTLEDAVRMLTLAPARAWGFRDRGLCSKRARSSTSTSSVLIASDRPCREWSPTCREERGV